MKFQVSLGGITLGNPDVILKGIDRSLAAQVEQLKPILKQIRASDYKRSSQGSFDFKVNGTRYRLSIGPTLQLDLARLTATGFLYNKVHLTSRNPREFKIAVNTLLLAKPVPPSAMDKRYIKEFQKDLGVKPSKARVLELNELVKQTYPDADIAFKTLLELYPSKFPGAV